MLRRSPRLPRALDVLRGRDFRLYWLGQAVSLVGMWAQGMAQSWLVLELTASAFALGLVNFAASAPSLLLSPTAGAVADRHDKRRILLASQAALMLLAFALGALVALGEPQLWQVLLIALGLGVATAFDLPANQAFVPELVERDQISTAIALNGAVFHGSRLIGPAVAGALVGSLGLASAFFINGVSFVAVIASLLLIRSRGVHQAARDGSQWEAIALGVRYVRGHALIAGLLTTTALTSLLMFPILWLTLPVYAHDVLEVDVASLGVLMAASGTGALVGAMGLLGVRRDQQLGRVMAGLVVLPLMIVALSVNRSFPLAMVISAVSSLGTATAMGLVATMIQEHVDPALRGRVMGLHTLTFMGVLPFSGLAVTGLADLYGLPVVMQGAAVVYLAGLAPCLWWLRASVERASVAPSEPMVAQAPPSRS